MGIGPIGPFPPDDFGRRFGEEIFRGDIDLSRRRRQIEEVDRTEIFCRSPGDCLARDDSLIESFRWDRDSRTRGRLWFTFGRGYFSFRVERSRPGEICDTCFQEEPRGR